MKLWKIVRTESLYNHRFLWPAYALFFLMLFVPTTYSSVKVVLLGLVFVMVVIRILARGRIILHPYIALWTLFLVSLGLFFILRGSIFGAPGALRVSTVYVMYPLVFTVLIAGIPTFSVLAGLIRTMVISSIIISLYSILYVFYAAGWIPDLLYFHVEQGQAVGFYEGFVEFRLHNIASMLFLSPFLLAAILTWPKEVIKKISRPLLWIGFILSLVVTLLSGRRALLVVVLITPFIFLFFFSFLPRKYKYKTRKLAFKTLIVGLVLFLILTFSLQRMVGLNIGDVLDNLVKGIQENLDSSVRVKQFNVLISGFWEKPLFGSGHGAAAEIQRSKEMPWAFELSYISLLYHTGLIGFISYVVAIIWIFWMGIRIISCNGRIGLYLLPVLVGMVSFLIANATNPYLGKFDYMWVIFLPLAFINYWLVNHSAQESGLPE